MLEAFSNDRPRGMAATFEVLDFGPYRTRLIGRLIPPWSRDKGRRPGIRACLAPVVECAPAPVAECAPAPKKKCHFKMPKMKHHAKAAPVAECAPVAYAPSYAPSYASPQASYQAAPMGTMQAPSKSM